MKCKICGKKGVQLSHWRRAHKDYMARRSREAKRCACGKRLNHRGEHKKGYKGSAASKTRTETNGARRFHANTHSDPSSSVPETPAGYVVETITWKRVA